MNSEQLRKSAALIRANGWCQNSLGRLAGYRMFSSQVMRAAEDGTPCQVCLVGSLLYIDTNHSKGDLLTCVSLVERRLRQRGEKVKLASVWNDLPGRTVDEVLNLLEETAVMAEENYDDADPATI
jgi:hypothetical protein